MAISLQVPKKSLTVDTRAGRKIAANEKKKTISRFRSACSTTNALFRKKKHGIFFFKNKIDNHRHNGCQHFMIQPKTRNFDCFPFKKFQSFKFEIDQFAFCSNSSKKVKRGEPRTAWGLCTSPNSLPGPLEHTDIQSHTQAPRSLVRFPREQHTRRPRIMVLTVNFKLLQHVRGGKYEQEL